VVVFCLLVARSLAKNSNIQAANDLTGDFSHPTRGLLSSPPWWLRTRDRLRQISGQVLRRNGRRTPCGCSTCAGPV